MSGQNDNHAGFRRVTKQVYVPPHRRRGQGNQQIQQQTSSPPATSSPPEKRVAPLEKINRDLHFTRICCINLRRRPDRWKTFLSNLRNSLGSERHATSFIEQLERWDAVDGSQLELRQVEGGNASSGGCASLSQWWEHGTLLPIVPEWDATQNSKWDKHIQPPFTKVMTPGEVGCALSHVCLWKELASMAQPAVKDGESTDNNATMLILEDDAVLYHRRLAPHHNPQQHQQQNSGGRASHREGRGRCGGRHDDGHSSPIINTQPIFLTALDQVFHKLHHTGWDILYLGFSDRGERLWLESQDKSNRSLDVRLFQPTYGFHTHAYAITASAAAVLLDHGPVQGPIDVWLADHQWFGLQVYAAVIANEGWQGTGQWLVTQHRRGKVLDSDVAQSANM